MFDPCFHIADRIGKFQGIVRILLEKVKCNPLRRPHPDPRKPGQFVHEVLNALGVIRHRMDYSGLSAMTCASGSLAPVLRGEGWGEGRGRYKLLSSGHGETGPSPQPSPPSTGEREPDWAVAWESPLRLVITHFLSHRKNPIQPLRDKLQSLDIPAANLGTRPGVVSDIVQGFHDGGPIIFAFG